MQKTLYDKIVSNLENNTPVTVYISPAHKCIEVELSKELQDSPDYDDMVEEFDSWFYEEGNNLTDYAIANSFDFDFSLEENELICDVSFVETNVFFPTSEEHDLTDLLSEHFQELIIKEVGIPAETFDHDYFEAEIEYYGGFDVLEFYYDDQIIHLNEDDFVGIKKEIEEVITAWGRFDSPDIKISLERGGNFIIEEPFTGRYVIDVDA